MQNQSNSLITFHTQSKTTLPFLLNKLLLEIWYADKEPPCPPFTSWAHVLSRNGHREWPSKNTQPVNDLSQGT